MREKKKPRKTYREGGEGGRERPESPVGKLSTVFGAKHTTAKMLRKKV